MGRARSGQVAYVRGRWVARVQLHRDPPGPNGRPRYFELAAAHEGADLTAKTPEARARAKRFAGRLQVLYDDGSWQPPRTGEAPASTATTVGEWVRRWLAAQKYSEAGRDLERVTRWLDRTETFRDLPLGKVGARDVAAWLDLLRTLPAKGGKPAAPRTLRNIADPVARALRAAVFDELLAGDPFSAVPSSKRPQAVDADPTARAGYRLSAVEVETLLGEPSIASRWMVMWHLLVLTGARVSEAIALRWSDIVVERVGLLRRVKITRQIHYKTRDEVPLKTKSCRDVPEHPLLRAVLAWWHSDGWREEYGREPTPQDFIIPCRGQSGRPWGTADGTGGPLWSQDVYRALQSDLTACGIDAHRVHDFRHTFASLCADAGMEESVASTWTHVAGGKTSRHLYRAPAWPRQSAEMMKLELSPRPWAATRSA